MSIVRGKCLGCGVALDLNVADPFAGATLAAALCSSCADCLFLDRGGAILELQRELEGARFELGKVTITSGAIAALGDAGDHVAAFLARHVRGDWGEYGRCDEIQLTTEERRRGWEATDDAGKINKGNVLARRNRIMSEYRTDRGTRLWVITNLDEAGGTTVLLPEEY